MADLIEYEVERWDSAVIVFKAESECAKHSMPTARSVSSGKRERSAGPIAYPTAFPCIGIFGQKPARCRSGCFKHCLETKQVFSIKMLPCPLV